MPTGRKTEEQTAPKISLWSEETPPFRRKSAVLFISDTWDVSNSRAICADVLESIANAIHCCAETVPDLPTPFTTTRRVPPAYSASFDQSLRLNSLRQKLLLPEVGPGGGRVVGWN